MLGPPRASLSTANSVLITEEIKNIERNGNQLHCRQKKKKKEKVNFAELLNMTVLKKIRKQFLEGGEDALACDDFCDVLSKFIPRSDVEALYKKIDVNDDGMVDWEEFTGFLISSEGGGTGDVLTKNSVQQFVLQREQDMHGQCLHSDLIEHIAFGLFPLPILGTAGKDGQLLLWNPKSFQFINSIDYRDKAKVFMDGVKKNVPQSDLARMKSRAASTFVSSKQRSYFTALAILPITGHICVSSADCCITVYDSPSLELTGCLSSSADIPTTMQAFAVLDKIRLLNTQYLAIGNSKGKVTVITLDDSFVVATDGPMQKKNNQEVWEKAVKNKYKWRIHRDWVTQLMYISEINRLVSSSLDGTIVLSTIDTQPSARVFRGHDTGVRCFAWSNASKILCSAGTDRSVLIWDPFTLQVAHRIENLTSMIVSINIHDQSQQIVFVMQDKMIKTWDSLTYECLNTSEDPSIQLPRNEISASLWVPDTDTLYTAGTRLCAFRNTTVINETSADEDDDLCKVLYNTNFYEIITVTKGGWVNVYYVGDGSSSSDFLITNSMQQRGSVGESSLSVLDAALDKVQRRLIVATNDNNEIQIWNFHSGLCIKAIRPRILHSLTQHPHVFPGDKKTFNITSLHYDHTFLRSGKINKRMLLFGTDLGVVSILIELPEDISEEPALNLVPPSAAETSFKKVVRIAENTAVPESSEAQLVLNPPHHDRHGQQRYHDHHDYHDDHDHHDHGHHHEQQKSKPKDVLWVRESSANNVLVAYGDGTVIEWNLEKGVRNIKIKPSDTLTGLSFMAFRRKFASNIDRRGGAVAGIAASGSSSDSIQDVHTALSPKKDNTSKVATIISEQEARRMSNTAVSITAATAATVAVPEDTDNFCADKIGSGKGRAGVQSSPIRKPCSKKLKPKARANGRRNITSAETSRTLLATYGSHYEKQISVAESGQETWTTKQIRGAVGPGSSFAAAIIGVAKKSQTDHPSLNPLLPDVSCFRTWNDSVATCNNTQKLSWKHGGSATTAPDAARVSLLRGAKEDTSIPVSAWGDAHLKDSAVTQPESQHHTDSAVVKSERNGCSEDDIATALHKVLPPPTPLTHTRHAKDLAQMQASKPFALGSRKLSTDRAHLNVKIKTPPPPAPADVGVSCMVSLKAARVAIGACSDSLFRFWDLDTARVICSCSIGLELKAVKNGGEGGEVTPLSDMHLSCLSLSPDEDLLIGGYDNGEIRVWIVSVASINNIRTTQKDMLSGMSVPPIQLLNEWIGHESALRSIEVVVLDEDSWGSHELYLVSSGQDQGVHLWTVSGEHVGSCGTNKGWDLEDRDTWSVTHSKFDYGGYQRSEGGHTGRGPPTSPSKPRPSFMRKNPLQKKYRIESNDVSTNFMRMAKLNRHMEKVKIKNTNKLTDPSTTEIHFNMVTACQARNPMTDVSSAIGSTAALANTAVSSIGTSRGISSRGRAK